MNIELLVVGKTDSKEVEALVELYARRVNRYCRFAVTALRRARRHELVHGGPYGFSAAVYARADGRLSLSRMTFSHQIVRAIFAEQIYRAFAILNHEPYHHE